MFVNYNKVIKVLNEHKIIGFPTETVYGLGIFYDDDIAYKDLVELKQREFTKPIAIMVNRHFDLDKFFVISDNARKIIYHFLPGPLTILLEAKNNFPLQCHLGTNIVGIRIPKNKRLQKLLKNVNKPLQVTSLNISGTSPITNYLDAMKTFGTNKNVGMILKGKCGSKVPTTIVDLTSNNIKIVREGEISRNDILEVLKWKLQLDVIMADLKLKKK